MHVAPVREFVREHLKGSLMTYLFKSFSSRINYALKSLVSALVTHLSLQKLWDEKETAAEWLVPSRISLSYDGKSLHTLAPQHNAFTERAEDLSKSVFLINSVYDMLTLLCQKLLHHLTINSIDEKSPDIDLLYRDR